MTTDSTRSMVPKARKPIIIIAIVVASFLTLICVGPAVLFVLLLPAGCDEDMANDASVANARGDTALLHIGACTGVGTFVEYSIALRLHGESKDRRHSHRLRFFFEGDYAPPSSPSTRDN